MTVIHRKITWLLLFSIFSLFVASWLIFVSRNNLERTNTRINQTHEIIDMMRQISFSISQPAPPAALQAGVDTLANLMEKFHDQQSELDSLRYYIRQAPTASLRNTTLTLLTNMIQKEKVLLNDRINQNKEVNQKVARGLIIARIIGFIFVSIVLIQLNRDISHRKRIQEHLEKAISDARQAKQMQEQFLANMSHEIRTPMNGIKGMTDLLLDTPLSQKQHELTGTIKNSVNNLLVVINDILDFSK
ncbi:MAG TPA: histidine kinase dimerization/phospho-acceptor domain-containing protein, partial [Puia sp.]|nr:histidine kinase dimerization/phospho-acceptor domain-containing protein [Puia sp.]